MKIEISSKAPINKLCTRIVLFNYRNENTFFIVNVPTFLNGQILNDTVGVWKVKKWNSNQN